MWGKMTDNCRIGDLAIVVRSAEGKSVGTIVKCIRRIEAGETVDGIFIREFDSTLWLVDRKMNWIKRNGTKYTLSAAYDRNLRPLRDDDGDDETLTWAEKPKMEKM